MEDKNNFRFNYSMLQQYCYAIYPICSLVRNDGFIIIYNRYKVDFKKDTNGIL